MAVQLIQVDWDEEVLSILRSEFYSKYSEAEFFEMMSKDLKSGSTEVFDKGQRRGTDLFCIRDGREVSAFLVLKYYDWELLGPQLYLQLSPGGMNLRAFNKLLVSEAKYAGELAYFWVTAHRRGEGIGKLLFDSAICEFRRLLLKQDIIFTLSLGNKSHLHSGITLRDALLNHERTNNGMDDQGKIKVTGLMLSCEEVERNLGFPLSEISSSKNSYVTELLAKKIGMDFLGYSRNLSLLFAATVDRLE